MKSSLDYYSYLFKMELTKSIRQVFSYIIFFVSFYLFVKDVLLSSMSLSSNITISSIFLFSLGSLIFDIMSRVMEINNFISTSSHIIVEKRKVIFKEDTEVELSEIKKTFRNKKYEYIQNEEFNIIYQKDINQKLLLTDYKIIINKSKAKRVKEFIKTNFITLKPFLMYHKYNSKKKKIFHNEKKLCLGSELLSDSTEVICYKSDYFSSILTNEVVDKVLFREEDDCIILDPRNFYPIYSNRQNQAILKTYDISIMNNHIGVSSLLFTSDSYLVLRTQNRKNLQNEGKIIPSCSGSVDYTDIQGDSFSETIKFAMERELIEENSIKSKKIDDLHTLIIGHFLHIERGGKPEFIGITKSEFTQSDLKINTEELRNDESSRVPMKFYIENMEDLKFKIGEILSLPNLSPQLVVGLEILRNHLEQKNKEILQFLF